MVQGELAVCGLLAVMDTQGLLEVVHTLAAAPQHTGHVRADLHVVLALRLLVKHIVETDDRRDLHRGDAQNGGQFVLRVHRAIAELPLDDVERRQHR